MKGALVLIAAGALLSLLIFRGQAPGQMLAALETQPVVLEQRRRTVRKRYDSLFTNDSVEAQPEASIIFAEDLSAEELQSFLGQYPVIDSAKAMRGIQMVRENTLTFQTLRGRRLLRDILPLLLDSALRSSNPDAVITNLESLTPYLASEESYLELLHENKSLVPTITKIFSRSEYLSRIIMKRAEYLALLGQDLYRRKSLAGVKEELRGIISSGMSLSDSIRMIRQMEEIRLDATATISYSLDDNAGGRFAIDANTGVVTVNGALDYETATSHSVTIRATSSDGSFATQSFSIAVTDVNESGITAISDTDGTADFVLENSVNGTTVGVTAFASDPDGTDTVSYALDDTAGGRFAIDAKTGLVTVAGGIDRGRGKLQYHGPRDVDRQLDHDSRVYDHDRPWPQQSNMYLRPRTDHRAFCC